jgi:competence protein ComEA
MFILRTLAAVVLSFAASLSFAAVDINKASQAELESIKGIGPAVSERMLAERGKQSFADWSDLQTRVKGVGPGNAAKFSAAGLTVNGKPFEAAPAAEKAAAKEPKPARAARAEKAAEKK